jgi:hypothetical protein
MWFALGSCETPSDVKHSVPRGSGRDALLLNGWPSARRGIPVINLGRGGPPDRRSFAAAVDPTDARKLVRHRIEESVDSWPV